MRIIPVNNSIMNSVTYILYNEDIDYCVLIDCGEYETLKRILDKICKRVKAVLLTHGHSDHIYGLNALLKDEPTLVIGTNKYGHEELGNPKKNLSYYHEHPFIIDGYEPLVLQDGMMLHFDGLADIEVISTPGHTASSMTYAQGKNLFTGDAYIPGLKTFSSFPGGNKEQAIKSMEMLSDMESKGFTIHCGHHSYK